MKIAEVMERMCEMEMLETPTTNNRNYRFNTLVCEFFFIYKVHVARNPTITLDVTKPMFMFDMQMLGISSTVSMVTVTQIHAYTHNFQRKFNKWLQNDSKRKSDTELPCARTHPRAFLFKIICNAEQSHFYIESANFMLWKIKYKEMHISFVYP